MILTFTFILFVQLQVGDEIDGVRMSPMGSAEGTSMTSGDRDDYAIYSRPKSPSEPP